MSPDKKAANFIGGPVGEGRPREGAASLSKQFICQRSDEPIRPMMLGNMRHNGVRRLFVTCSACGHYTYVDFIRAMNLSMLDSVVAKEVTKRTRT